MSGHFIGLWRATYLLSYPETQVAKADKRHAGLYRHVSLISADDRQSVLRLLKAKGAVAVEVHPAPLPHPFFRRVKGNYKRAFIQALLFAVEGGISPGRALESLIMSETGTMRTRFNVALELLQSGRPFIEVMRALDLFDVPTLSILEAGEEAGKLKNALGSAIAHMSKSDTSIKLMFAAVGWTGLDLFMAASSVIGIRFAMLPKIKADGPGVGATPQQVADFERILGIATFGNDVLLTITVLLSAAIAWGLFAYFGRNESRREQIDAVLLRFPLVGQLYIHAAVSSTAAIMSNLMRGGVNFIPACAITLRGTRIPAIRRYWQRASEMAEAGEPIAKAMGADPMSHLEQMVLTAHTNSKQLADALDEISRGREEESKSAAKRFGIVAFIASMTYSGLAVLLALAVVWAQSTAAMSTPGG